MLDKSWKEKFNEIALAQGKERYMGNRVADLKKDGDHYSAGILGRERRNVSLVLKDGKPIRMICSCPKAKSGSKCEHMAALLYALEAQFHPEDDPKKMAEKERLERQKALVLQAEEAKKRDIAKAEITDEEMHVLCTIFWTSVYEPFIHEMSWKEIEEHCKVVCRFMDWKNAVGIMD